MKLGKTIDVDTRKKWRAWLEVNHDKEPEVWLIYFKKHTGRPRVEYNDSVEEALCFGWIDNTVKTIDQNKYAQRFSPRRGRSNWSEPNRERLRKLIKSGLMTPAGLAVAKD